MFKWLWNNKNVKSENATNSKQKDELTEDVTNLKQKDELTENMINFNKVLEELGSYFKSSNLEQIKELSEGEQIFENIKLYYQKISVSKDKNVIKSLYNYLLNSQKYFLNDKNSISKCEVKFNDSAEIVSLLISVRDVNLLNQLTTNCKLNGEDDCKEYYVSREKLEELLSIVNKVLEKSEFVEGKIKNGSKFENGKEIPIMEDGKYIKNPSVAKKLLPTRMGFFFGSEEYDEYYFEGLKNTKEIKEHWKKTGIIIINQVGKYETK